MANAKQALKAIKTAERAVAKGGMTPARAKKLLLLFKGIVSDGSIPLSYVDATTDEEINRLYGIEVEDEFRMMDEKEIQLKGANNPRGYQWLTQDIELVVLGNTSRNRKIAKAIVRLILRELEKMAQG